MDDQSLFKPIFKGYHVRFKDDLFRAIQAVAEAECRSFNEQVIHFCRRCLLANDTREVLPKSQPIESSPGPRASAVKQAKVKGSNNPRQGTVKRR